MAVVGDYVDATKRIAADYGARLVDTHAMFAEQLKHHRADAFGDEPVHPNATGHLMMAHAWLTAMGW